MVEKHTEGRESKESFYENLEEVARGHIQRFLQDVLEQEGKIGVRPDYGLIFLPNK